MSRLRELVDLQQLRRVIFGTAHGTVEREFLRYACFAQDTALAVAHPKLYRLQGEEAAHHAEAVRALGIEGKPDGAIDIAGAFNYSHQGFIILVSPEQVNADHICQSRSYLNPLLRNIFIDGPLRDFGIHEALFARVEAFAGKAKLDELHLFPERFSTGQYKLEARLETPHSSMSRFAKLMQEMERLGKSPAEFLLGEDAVRNLAAEATSLREKLGALSRYNLPKAEHSASVDSCIVKSGDCTAYFLHSAETGNVAVHFGKCALNEENKPLGLALIDGAQPGALSQLVLRGLMLPSAVVAEQRINELQRFYDDTTRGSGQRMDGSELSALLSRLRAAKPYLEATPNALAKRRYTAELPPHVMELVVCPPEDAVLHELLPRLSSSSAVREYHDTEGFIRSFDAGDDACRMALVRKAVSALLFTNQQNHDANSWLYDKHRELCQKAGAKFRVIE